MRKPKLRVILQNYWPAFVKNIVIKCKGRLKKYSRLNESKETGQVNKCYLGFFFATQDIIETIRKT